ncbi:MAG: 4Fe-4S ferredoxin [Desulfuromonas sp.]|nr:MAG: 4Fe-4S ferredoxin [Desulfuromonas sp.]
MSSPAEKAGTRQWVDNLIFNFWKTSPLNTLNLETGEKAWEEPLVAVARGNDPLFQKFKADLKPFYWLPEEAWSMKFPDEPITPEELSVISYVLPQTPATRADQRLEEKLPADRWARSRDLGEKFNCALRLHLADALTEAGYPAVAPERLPDFAYQQSETFGIASNWSERHTAYVAGLGTFGLSDGLITPKGKAVRIGSVVAKIDLPVIERPYTDYQQWCLWYAFGKCGVCIRRCPVKAITPAGHDKERCFDYIRGTTAPYAQSTYGTEATPCGLCQVKIPCEDRIPV